MAPPVCGKCHGRGEVKRPRTGEVVCRPCFFQQVEEEVHETIVSESMFEPGDIVACGASGGKDSTVLLHLLTLLNNRHQYGIDIRLISVDEGITGYRDDSLATVKENAETYGLPLHILSYADLFGWTMDEIVKVVGLKNNCTYCGVLRRQALERGASLIGATSIVTGHNADDNAETLLMNILRADVPRLRTAQGRDCPSAPSQHPSSTEALQGLPRVKPMKSLYQKDIVMYAYHKKLVYFTTECTYAQEAFRGTVRTLIKQLEAIQPKCIANILTSAAQLPLRPEHASHSRSATASALRACVQCGASTNQSRCRACLLLSSLDHRLPKEPGESSSNSAVPYKLL